MIEVEQLDRWCLPKGVVIKCPNPYCGQHIGHLVKDIRQGDPLTSKCFAGPQVRQGERPRCLNCNHLWYFEGPTTTGSFSRLHTGRGWFPEEERLVNGF